MASIRCLILACAAACASQSVLFAESSDDKPRPIPLTRPEMKQYLEQMKSRKPRIPLPELTAEELSKLDERAAGYEGRLRALYLPPSDGRGGFGRGSFMRNSDPQMTLDYRFKTMLFWIVSRTNNCQYCMGHQESKLLSAGMQEDEIAGLDGDWLEFSEAERAAFALARKLTYEPHKLSDADIDAVAKHYTRLQILEMVLSVAGNNSINRWKEGVGVPQSANGGAFGHRDENGQLKADAPREQSYLTPTSEANQKKITKVAPVEIDPKTGAPSSQTVCRRPTLESREEVERLLEAGRSRKPRLPMADEAAARAVVAEDWSDRALPQWVLLLASFPVDAKNRVASIRTAEEKGDMSPLAKAQASWIIARQDRAWYALGESKRRLAELGWADDRIYTLDGDWSQFTPAERALFTVAQKLAASPVVLTDEDVSRALQLAGPRDVVQWISYTTNRAAFDRITEAAGLTVGK